MATYSVRRFDPKDIDCRVAWFNSPEIYEKMPIEIPVSHATTLHWFSKIVGDESRFDFVLDRYDNQESSEVVAMAGIVDINQRHRRSEIYILVSPDKTGKGIGSLFMIWLCNYSFYHLGMEKLFLYTIERNHEARKFYERLGFAEEGTLRKHQFHCGKRVDRYIQGLLREEWDKSNYSDKNPVNFIIDPNKYSPLYGSALSMAKR